MLVLVLVCEAVHVLVPAEVQSAGPVYHEVRAGAVGEAGVVVPELELAPVAHYEGLHVVPPEAGGEERQDPLVPGSELQEVSAAGTFLLVVQSRAQTLRDLNTDIQSSPQILIIALLYPDVVALVLSYLGSQGQPSQT